MRNIDEVSVPVVTPSECAVSMGSREDGQICAGGEAGKDSCVGDSGSGLMRLVLDEEVSDWSRWLQAPSDWFLLCRSPPSTSPTSSAWSVSARDSAAPRACPGCTPGSTASSTGSWTPWTPLKHVYFSFAFDILYKYISVRDILSGRYVEPVHVTDHSILALVVELAHLAGVSNAV